MRRIGAATPVGDFEEAVLEMGKAVKGWGPGCGGLKPAPVGLGRRVAVAGEVLGGVGGGGGVGAAGWPGVILTSRAGGAEGSSGVVLIL